MFEHIQCEQNTPEWFKSRLGKWIASQFSKCLSPTGKISKSASKVNDQLILERLTGERKLFFQSDAMKRGNELEPEALSWINDNSIYNFEDVGFFCSGLGYGCSPDAVDWGHKLGIEVKCPNIETHLKYLKDAKIPTKYYSQVQGQLLVSGFDSWYFLSYFPNELPLMVRVERDEPFIEQLKEELLKNIKLIEEGVDEVTIALQG